MKFPTTSLGFALLALTTISAAEPQDPTQNDAIDSASTAITDFIIKPISQELSDRMMRGFAENEGVIAPAAKEHLKQRKIEEQIAYDEEMKRRHTAIMEAKRCNIDCKPRPIQDCMKT